MLMEVTVSQGYSS